MFDTAGAGCGALGDGDGRGVFGGAGDASPLWRPPPVESSAHAARDGFGSAPDGVAAQRLAAAFERCRGPDGFVPAEDGRRHLEGSGLPTQMLQAIWHLSDLDRDGRLSLREFVCAAQLATHVASGRALPAEVTTGQQLAMIRGVERLIGQTGATGAAPDASKPGRLDEFSTRDTAASQAGAFGTAGRRADHGFLSASGGAHGDGGGSAWAAADAQAAECPATAAASSRGLGQLASVLDVVARLDDGPQLKRLSRDVLEERKALEQQLSRRREFERDLQTVRASLDGVREERRRVESRTAATQRRISHLQDELAWVEGEARGAEQDFNALVDAGAGEKSVGSRQALPYDTHQEERHDVMGKARAEREMLQRDQRSIAELRQRLAEICASKRDAQVRQQDLLEKQRQAEQDRGLMLTAIEAERGKLSAMRAERLKLWEERGGLEREVAAITQHEIAASSQAAAVTAVAASSRSVGAGGVGDASRGVPATGILRAELGQQQRRGVPAQEAPAVVYGEFPDAERASHAAARTQTTAFPFATAGPAGVQLPLSAAGAAAQRQRGAAAPRDCKGVRN